MPLPAHLQPLARKGVHVKIGLELLKLSDIATTKADDAKSITVTMKGGRKVVLSRDGFDAAAVKKKIDDKKVELNL